MTLAMEGPIPNTTVLQLLHGLGSRSKDTGPETGIHVQTTIVDKVSNSSLKRLF